MDVLYTSWAAGKWSQLPTIPESITNRTICVCLTPGKPSRVMKCSTVEVKGNLWEVLFKLLASLVFSYQQQRRVTPTSPRNSNLILASSKVKFPKCYNSFSFFEASAAHFVHVTPQPPPPKQRMYSDDLIAPFLCSCNTLKSLRIAEVVYPSSYTFSLLSAQRLDFDQSRTL